MSFEIDHPETTPLSQLPLNIRYARKHKGYDTFIVSFLGARQDKKLKQFSIKKYTLPIAYRKAIEYIYGKDKVEEIVREYPVPYIHPDDLLKPSNKYTSSVFGVFAIFSLYNGVVGYLSGFASGRYEARRYFSITKLGLEEAWKRAVEHRYSINEPVPTDKPELPAEYWDMINPKNKRKIR